MEKLFSKNDLDVFMRCNYNELQQYHFGFGLWIRNHLLRENDELYLHFLNCGITQKDDMSSLILRLFYIYVRTKYKGRPAHSIKMRAK